MTQHLHPRFGRDFVDEFLLAIVAGNIEGSRDKELWSAIQKRVTQARKLLLDLRSTPGRPKSDDDWDLIQIGSWIWSWCDLDEHESPTSIDFTKVMIRKAALLVARTTPEAAKLSRVKTLTKKFQEDARRIMEIIEQEAYDAKRGSTRISSRWAMFSNVTGCVLTSMEQERGMKFWPNGNRQRARSRKDGNTQSPNPKTERFKPRN